MTTLQRAVIHQLIEDLAKQEEGLHQSRMELEAFLLEDVRDTVLPMFPQGCEQTGKTLSPCGHPTYLMQNGECMDCLQGVPKAS